LFGSSETTLLISSQLRGACFMRLGYTDFLPQDGSKALCRTGEKPRENSTKMGWLQHVIAEHKSHLINGNLRVQKVECALPQETLTA